MTNTRLPGAGRFAKKSGFASLAKPPDFGYWLLKSNQSGVAGQRSFAYAAAEHAGLIRLGILTLPIAGPLKLVGQLGIFDVVGPGVDDREAAQAVSTTGYFVGQFVGSILAVTLTIFGVIAPFAYLTNTSAGRWAPVAMVLSILGLALILSSLGVLAYALPAIGKAYLAGQEDAFRIADAFFSGPLIAIFFLSLFYAAGSILFGIEIWRSGALPKWAGVLYAVSGLLLSFPLPIDVLRVVSAVLLAFGGGWISLSVLR